ncbi:hypothetical protein [Brevundimonas sp.]|uniref:hypothetical protein n=1 Tax=Brevundimonas sp. TaxID=1871086 RepID=UPI0025C31045|nr:hypothetical protein [Brevundimonas sp.]
MDDQLRPVEAGVGALPPHPYQHEHDVLCEVSEVVSQAMVEFSAGHHIAARLEVVKATRMLSALVRGEAV